MSHSDGPEPPEGADPRRVLHVDGLFTPDNAYGGPVTVALNLAAAQRRAGAAAAVVGGYRGWRSAPKRIDGQPVLARRSVSPLGRHSLHGLFAPGLIVWSLVRLRRTDVVHVHMTRDLTTLPIAAVAALLHVPYVIQPHGQVDGSTRPAVRVLDALLTRRVLRRAGAVAHLTAQERDDLLAVEPGIAGTLHAVSNGVPVPSEQATPDRSDEVLFAARLHPRKRALTFVEAAGLAAEAVPNARFVLAGADEGDGPRVEASIISHGLEDLAEYIGALDHAGLLSRMTGAAVYVLPSIGEVFPMSVLEALAAGLPVVIGRSSALAGPVDEAQAGLVVEDDAAAYAHAIARLMREPETRRIMGANARRLIEERFGIDAAARGVSAIYPTRRA